MNDFFRIIRKEPSQKLKVLFLKGIITEEEYHELIKKFTQGHEIVSRKTEAGAPEEKNV